MQVSIDNKDTWASAFDSVRRGNNDWVLVEHKNEDPQAIGVEATGTTFAELKAKINPTKVQYALYKTTIKVDLSQTTKFVYIYNLGEQVGFAKKGRYGVVKGKVTELFHPFHVDTEIVKPDELVEDELVRKLKEAAGVYDHVKDDRDVNDADRKTLGSKKAGSMGSLVSLDTQQKPQSISNIAKASAGSPSATTPKIADAIDLHPDVEQAIAEVRNDKSATNWFLASYLNGDVTTKQLVLVGKGQGGVTELSEKLDPSAISYGLIRKIDIIDGHSTVKFAFVNWIGQEVSIMKKAKVATQRGSVLERVGQFHVDINASERRDISDELIMEKIQLASGSKAR